MKYPTELSPTACEQISLPNGSSVEVPKATPTFSLWHGTAPSSSYGGKAILTYQAQPAFAELLILRTFAAEGWDGVWIDTFRQRYLRGFWPEPDRVELPAEQLQVLAKLSEQGRAKPWDVFCWSGDNLVFVEAKRAKKDRIRASQVAFLQNALAAGITESSFLIVEWRLSNSA